MKVNECFRTLCTVCSGQTAAARSVIRTGELEVAKSGCGEEEKKEVRLPTVIKGTATNHCQAVIKILQHFLLSVNQNFLES